MKTRRNNSRLFTNLRVWTAIGGLAELAVGSDCILPEVVESASSQPEHQPTFINVEPSTQVSPETDIATGRSSGPADTSAAVNSRGAMDANAGAAGSAAAPDEGRAASGANAAQASTPPVRSGEPCQGAAARCSKDFLSREQCIDGLWTEAPCGEGSVCSSIVDDEPGTCRLISPACSGRGGGSICDARGNLMACTSQEVIESTETCLTPRLCNARLRRCDVDPCPEWSERCKSEAGAVIVEQCRVPSGSTTTSWLRKKTCLENQRCEMFGRNRADCVTPD